MIKLLKLFLIFSVPLVTVMLIYTFIQGKYYESFAMVELFPEIPLSTYYTPKAEYSYSYRWIPWPSLLKSQVKLLKNSNFHKIIYKNLPHHLKTYIKEVYNSRELYKYISANLKISPVLDSNIIEFYFYDKDREKAREILNTIINTYIKEREKLFVFKKKQLERVAKKIENLLFQHIKEFIQKLSSNTTEFQSLPPEVLQSLIVSYSNTSNTIKDVLGGIHFLLQNKNITDYLNEKFVSDLKKMMSELQMKYNEYSSAQLKKMRDDLLKAYINDTYKKAVVEIQHFFSRVLIDKYNKLIEASSGIGTINVSIPVTVSDRAQYPNLGINLLGAIAVGFLLSLFYFVFITEDSATKN